jgi:serine/alanine adding enzyme
MECSGSLVQVEAKAVPGGDWNSFVESSAAASLYHRAEWVQLIRDVFRQKAFFLEARSQEGKLLGVLPLVQQRGPLLGKFMTSLPYFNYGGVVATSDVVAHRLMESARTLAQEQRCRYVELRDTVQYEGDWIARTDKVSMILTLPEDSASLAKSLGSKLRAQVRRPEREHAEVSVNAVGSLDAFYDVFCRNMHALGTPVYPRRFFKALLDAFPDICSVLVIHQQGIPQAAGFLLLYGDTAEIPWAACREDAKSRGYNMKMYWECLIHAIGRGCRQFDFGRSTANSGTYRFKAQWGAKPRQLYWYRWNDRDREGDPQTTGPSRMREVVARIWSTLPLSVANVAGPLISPRLPW